MAKNKVFIGFAIAMSIALIALLLKLIGGNGKDEGMQDKNGVPEKLNISIFIDMSDRIIGPNSDQVTKDTLIVGETVKYFVDKTKSIGLQPSDNIIKVIFNPAPAGEVINNAADSLSLDIQAVAAGGMRKKRVKGARNTFTRNLADVYSKAIEYGKTNSWPGSDLWGFFNNGVVDKQCIKNGYRNVLIVITDGEVFYSPTNKTVDGKPNFVSSELLKNPKGTILVERGATLQELEVMILEINPRDPKDLPRMKQVLENWLVEMGIKKDNIELYQTDTPANVRTVINKFLKRFENNPNN